MAKLDADIADVERGSFPSSPPEFLLHFVKMGFGVQKLQLEQMYAIGETMLEHYASIPRLHVLGIWGGFVAPDSFSIFSSSVAFSLIRRVIRPPTVRLRQLV
jgi:hypothetical protein